MTDDIDRIPDMTRLRARIDVLDAELVALLARRVALIRRAAAIKARDGLPARIPWRVEEVAANARRHAVRVGLDPDLAEALGRQLIDHAIALEEKTIPTCRAGDDDPARGCAIAPEDGAAAEGGAAERSRRGPAGSTEPAAGSRRGPARRQSRG